MFARLPEIIDKISLTDYIPHGRKNIFSIPFLMIGWLINSLIPKVNPNELCEAWKLCSVRERNGEYMVAVKYLDGHQTEIPLQKIVDAEEYLWLPIVRTYSSGHVFLSDDKNSVYLVTTEKDGKIQHQFTGWSPLESEYSNIIYQSPEWKTKINIYKVEDNADQRTFMRTGVRVTDVYNEMPLVDRVLMEREDEQGKKYRRIVLLMHFIVKSYEWILGFKKGNEQVVDGKRYTIDELPNTANVAPNAYLISTKAREII